MNINPYHCNHLFNIMFGILAEQCACQVSWSSSVKNSPYVVIHIAFEVNLYNIINDRVVLILGDSDTSMNELVKQKLVIPEHHFFLSQCILPYKLQYID